ncbi:MAG: alpha-L-fucosidase [Promethearchaeota archaeon]
MKYIPTKKSLSRHQVPRWYHDAKLGIFIHWGLYSIPAFAVVRGKTFPEIIATEGVRGMMFQNPYSEWYLNSLRIEGTRTREYHEKKYGLDFEYDDFIPIFNDAIKSWDPDKMAGLFKAAGARYVVLVTKHHDGFCLWPPEKKHPTKEGYHSSRDIVGELSRSVKANGMEMGVYYSSLLDWSFTPTPITGIGSQLNNEPRDDYYPRMVEAHWHELIDTIEPGILWSDIGYPSKGNFNEIFAYYYNKMDDGVVNDRWFQIPGWMKRMVRFKPIERLVEWTYRRVFSRKDAPVIKPRYHHDFITPEYTSFKMTPDFKWECTRGIGYSFGYNKVEKPADMLSLSELIHMFVDIVSKNGNLLLNVGPKADGTIPKYQEQLLLDLGNWLSINGEGIYSTRPWRIPESVSKDGIGLRFTSKEDAFFTFLLEVPEKKSVEMPLPGIPTRAEISLLDKARSTLEWKKDGNSLVIYLPEELPRIDLEARCIGVKIKY